MEEPELKKKLIVLLNEQRLAVLSSNKDDQPYPSLIAFAHTDDLKYIFFATLRNSNKYKNIKNNPKASLLIDNRENTPLDIYNAIAVSVFGTVSEIETSDKGFNEIFLKKYPYLKDFLEMEDCSILKIKVDKYIVISKFQNKDILIIN